MNKEQVFKLMDAIPADLIEEADIQAPAKRRLPKVARAGLIAACLCLVLVGTGAAAVATGWIRTDISIIQLPHNDGRLVSVSEVAIAADGRSYIPWESFSQEAHDFSSSALGLPKYKGFDSWDELERFLGLEIFDNPVLDQAELVTHENTSSLGGRRVEGNCFAGFYGLTEAPGSVWMDALYRLEDDDGKKYTALLEGYIFTEPSERDEWGTGYKFTNIGEESVTPTTEIYTTPSGLQAAIVTLNLNRRTIYFVSFQLNNVTFDLHMLSEGDVSVVRDDPDQMLSIVKEILDAFS